MLVCVWFPALSLIVAGGGVVRIEAEATRDADGLFLVAAIPSSRTTDEVAAGMEPSAIILILAPVFTPVLSAYQIDPVYFGILLCINLAIGANTPPLGIDLMAACRTAGIPMSAALRHLLPFLGAMVAVLLLLVLFPQIITGVIGSR